MGAKNSHEPSPETTSPRTNQASQIKKLKALAMLKCPLTLSVEERDMLGDNQAIVAAAIFQLNAFGLLSIDTRALLLKSTENAIVVCHELKKLNDANLFSIENVQAIAKAPQHVSTLVYVLTELNKTKTLTDVSLASITLESLATQSRHELIDEAHNVTALQAIHEINEKSVLPKIILNEVLAPFFKKSLKSFKSSEEHTDEEADSNQKQSACQKSGFLRHAKTLYPSSIALFPSHDRVTLTPPRVTQAQNANHSGKFLKR